LLPCFSSRPHLRSLRNLRFNFDPFDPDLFLPQMSRMAADTNPQSTFVCFVAMNP
jgi:hypothetical protein